MILATVVPDNHGHVRIECSYQTALALAGRRADPGFTFAMQQLLAEALLEASIAENAPMSREHAA